MASRIWILALALAVIGLGACGGDDDDGGSDDSAAELSSSLPAAGDLGLEERSGASDWEDAREFLAGTLVIGGTTNPSDLAAELEDAGFEAAAGQELVDIERNVRVRVVQFDSEDGAAEARDLLHEEDLKSPCPDACIVTPVEYELDDIPDSAAVHHVPTGVKVPEGGSKVEAHHAEFVVGPKLYVVQVDGKPSPSFTADFDELMGTVYESASSGE